MGVSAKELDVNIKHVNELAKQIRNNTDCEVIRLIVEEHLDSVRDLFKDIQEEQKELLAKILPLLSLPGLNPAAIVKWISKLVTGLITPQLLAHIKYTKKLIQLGAAILNVISAIREAVQNLPECILEIKDEVLSEIEGQINTLINSALTEIADSQQGLLAIIDVGNTISQIDTSSPEAFIATVDQAVTQINTKVEEYKGVDLPAGSDYQDTTVTTVSTDTSTQIISSFNKNEFRSAKYMVQIHYDSQFESTEVLLMHNNTTAFFTEYGTISSDGSLGTISANVNGTSVDLLIEPSNPNTEITIQRVSLLG
jgi:hypothetical protein